MDTCHATAFLRVYHCVFMSSVMAQSPRASSFRFGREIHPLSAHKEDTNGSSLEDFSHFSWFKWELAPSEWDILLVSTCLKLLLFPS